MDYDWWASSGVNKQLSLCLILRKWKKIKHTQTLTCSERGIQVSPPCLSLEIKGEIRKAASLHVTMGIFSFGFSEVNLNPCCFSSGRPAQAWWNVNIKCSESISSRAGLIPRSTYNIHSPWKKQGWVHVLALHMLSFLCVGGPKLLPMAVGDPALGASMTHRRLLFAHP